MPAFVDRPGAEGAAGERQPERALFPFGMEIGLVLFRRDRAETMLAAKILRAVHCPSPTSLGSPVPIIESRVTRSASASSSKPSVPSGRSGMTI